MIFGWGLFLFGGMFDWWALIYRRIRCSGVRAQPVRHNFDVSPRQRVHLHSFQLPLYQTRLSRRARDLDESSFCILTGAHFVHDDSSF